MDDKNKCYIEHDTVYFNQDDKPLYHQCDAQIKDTLPYGTYGVKFTRCGADSMYLYTYCYHDTWYTLHFCERHLNNAVESNSKYLPNRQIVDLR